MNDEEIKKVKDEDIPKMWPNHLDKAIHILNKHLLLSLKFSLKKLLFGLMVNMKPTDIAEAEIPTRMMYQCKWHT